MKNPYPENQQVFTQIKDHCSALEDTMIGGERLATKWYVHNGLTVVVVQKERAYLCYGFDQRQEGLLK